MAKSRRTNNEGSIYFDEKLQRFVGQFRYIDPKSNTQKRKKFTDKRKSVVLKKGRAFLQSMENIESIQANTKEKKEGPLFGQYMEEWLEYAVRPTIRQKTYERYESMLRCYIIPHIGKMPIGDLNRVVLQKFLSDLAMHGGENRKKLSPSTINGTRRLIKTALDLAVADGLIENNAANLTKAMRTTKRNMAIFTPEEYQRLLVVAKAHSDRAYLVIRIAFATGFRIGEIFGLEYSSVDFAKNLISVKQTVVSTRHGKRLQQVAKNSSSIRTIKVEQKLIDELLYYKELHEQRKKLYRNKFEIEHDFIIENEDGSYCDPAYFSDKIFKKSLLKKANLSNEFRMHDCRHTHATWLISKGVNLKAVSERLGHKSIRTTLDIYSHMTKSMQDEAVDALEEILSEQS